MNRLLPLVALLGLSLTGCAKDPAPGSYSSVATGDPGVQAAATFAVGDNYKLIRVIRAEKQVVAGTNYALTLEVEVKGERKTAHAVVWWQSWRTPPYRLTSWSWKPAP